MVAEDETYGKNVAESGRAAYRRKDAKAKGYDPVSEALNKTQK